MKTSNLKNASTAELVSELSGREGVRIEVAKPYEDIEVSVNGPAIVLTVID